MSFLLQQRARSSAERFLTVFLLELASRGSSAANIAEETRMQTSTLLVKYEWLTILLQNTLDSHV